MTYQQSTVGQYFVVVSREKFVDFLQVYGGVHLSLVQLSPNRSGYLAVGKLGPVETLQWVGRLQKIRILRERLYEREIVLPT